MEGSKGINIFAMEIKLQRLGGFIPIKRESSTQVTWSEEELKKLLEHIRADENEDTLSRDATIDYLEVEGALNPINMQKVPAKYKPVFEELKTGLKPVRS